MQDTMLSICLYDSTRQCCEMDIITSVLRKMRPRPLISLCDSGRTNLRGFQGAVGRNKGGMQPNGPGFQKQGTGSRVVASNGILETHEKSH